MSTLVDCLDFYFTETDEAEEELASARTYIEEIIKEIETNPKDIIQKLKDLREEYKERLLDSDHCPECGAELSFEANGKDTMVNIDGVNYTVYVGGELVCPECGYVKEED